MFSKLDKISSLIEEVSDLEIMPRFRNLSDDDISQKEGGETVTIADIETEKRLSGLLKDLFPGSNVIGEEIVAQSPGLLENILQDQMTWVIDPVDGTNNFAKGIETFKCMLALIYKGETIAGWIYDPVRRTTLHARQNEGAYLDNKKLSLRVPANYVDPDCIGTLHGSKGRNPKIASKIELNKNKLNVVKTLRCAGADYERLVTSKTQFSLYTRLMPWDHLAGVLLHHEAGGYSACLNGINYSFEAYNEKGLLLAPNKEIWDKIQKALFC